MLAKRSRFVCQAGGLALVASALLMAGCKGGAGGGQSDAALIAAGKGVFDSNGCARCHGGGGRAPDLSHEGADPSHTPQWIAQHVKNPRSQNPRSRMPAFEGKINDQDLNALGTYLASLK
jgi:mono/diheme cytochrome c family protein